MGNGNTPDRDLTDVNLFAAPRNLAPDNGPSNIQREGYTDYVPAGRQPMQTAGLDNPGQGRPDRRGMVEIDNGNEVIYAPAGSRVVIRHNNDGGYEQVGNGPNGFVPNFDDTRRQVMMSRQTELAFEHRGQWPASYYRHPQPIYRPGLQNVDAGDWQSGQPFVPSQPAPQWDQYQYAQRNTGAEVAGSFLGAVAGVFLNRAVFGGGHQQYWGGHQPYWNGGGRHRFYGGNPGLVIQANLGNPGYGYYGQNPPNYGWG